MRTKIRENNLSFLEDWLIIETVKRSPPRNNQLRNLKMIDCKKEIETKRKNRIINLVWFFCVYKRGIQ